MWWSPTSASWLAQTAPSFPSTPPQCNPSFIKWNQLNMHQASEVRRLQQHIYNKPTQLQAHTSELRHMMCAVQTTAGSGLEIDSDVRAWYQWAKFWSVPGGAGSGGAADSSAGRRDSNFGALHAAANLTSGRRKQLNYKLQLNSFDDSSFYTYSTLNGRAKRCIRYIVQHPSLHRDHKFRSWAAGDLSIWSHSKYGHHTAVC